MMQTWKQTFQAADGTVLSGASVNVYLAGTTVAARIFDVNDVLHDTAPQLTTDADGFIEFSFDTDDFSTGQLFDVNVVCNFLCNTVDDVDLKSIKLLQDTEGGLEFQKTFYQTGEPTDSTIREGDIWIDTDDDNALYTYTGGSWVAIGGSGTPGAPGADAGNWSSNLVFSATDYNTVAWASGVINTADTNYSISAGNTGNMSAATPYYMYLKPSVSITVLQITTTAVDAVGANQILVGVAQASTSPISAGFQIFGGQGGVFVNADNIAANCIAADKIVANSITADEMDVSTLDAITANVGTLTTGIIQNAAGTTYFNLTNGTMSLGGRLTWNGTTLAMGYGDITGGPPTNADNTVANETFNSSSNLDFAKVNGTTKPANSATRNTGALADLSTVTDAYVTSISGGKITTGIIADGNDSWWNLGTNRLRMGSSSRLEFGSNAQHIYGNIYGITILAGSANNYMMIDQTVGCMIRAKYAAATPLSLASNGPATVEAGTSLYLTGADYVIYDASASYNHEFKFGGTRKVYISNTGLVPNATAAAIILGNTTQLWAGVYASNYYDENGLFQDAFDDLEEMQKHKPVMKKVINKETGKESSVLDTTDDGLQKLDVYSIPKEFVNYEEVKQKLRDDNCTMLSEEDIEEYVSDRDEAGWMLLRNVGRFNDMSAGAIRQLDHVVNDLSFELADWISSIDIRLKNLEKQ